LVPGFVLSVEDYWLWLDQIIEASDGYTEAGPLLIEPVFDEDELVGLVVPFQELRFWDETRMWIALSVTEELELLKYVFHLQTAEGDLIWRIDNVGDHLGGGPHVHRRKGASEVIDPWSEVDLQEALDYRSGLPDVPPV
jgi:hypothetical protein